MSYFNVKDGHETDLHVMSLKYAMCWATESPVARINSPDAHEEK